MNLKSLESQLKSTESQLGQYTSELPSQIEAEMQRAYTPMLQESTGVTRDMMGDYLGKYYDVTTMGPGMAGTTAADLSPTQKLGVMGKELGTMSGNLQASQQYSDYLGAQMTSMYQKALQAAQMGQQNLADKYSRISQQYQLAWQEAENAKDRALQSSIANQQINANKPQPLGEADKLAQWQQKVAQVKNIRGKSNIEGATINSYQSALLKEARDLGLNVNNEQLWQMLGNTPYKSPFTGTYSGGSLGGGGGSSW